MRLFTIGKGGIEVLYPLGGDEIAFRVDDLEKAFRLEELFRKTLEYNETGRYRKFSESRAKVYTGFRGKAYVYPVAYRFNDGKRYFVPLRIVRTWIALEFDNKEIAEDWANILREAGYEVYQS